MCEKIAVFYSIQKSMLLLCSSATRMLLSFSIETLWETELTSNVETLLLHKKRAKPLLTEVGAVYRHLFVESTNATCIAGEKAAIF